MVNMLEIRNIAFDRATGQVALITGKYIRNQQIQKPLKKGSNLGLGDAKHG